jgi:hypothetical protein
MMFFKNIHTGKRYQVIRLDRSRNLIMLKGETQEFSVPYDLDLIERCGYELVESDNA